MQILYDNSMNGILADEMGLGKTVQSIGFIALLLEKNISGPFLVIAPASTIDNWDDEFRRFAPQIRCVVYHGSLEDRSFLRQEYFSPKGLEKAGKFKQAEISFDITLISYCTFVSRLM